MLSGCTVDNPRQVMGSIKLGADLPLSGDDAPDGVPVKNAIELAIKQANLVCGASRHRSACFELQALTLDDVSKGIHDPARGVENVQVLAADSSVLAIVGPLHDSVARSEIPIANGAHLALISPATTDECLTQEPSDGHCRRLAARLREKGANTFFRVVTTQLVEGAAAADLAFAQLAKRRAFVVNDQTPFGLALAAEFTARFTHDGGSLVAPAELGGFDPGQPLAFGPALERARSQGADVVYFSGAGTLAAAALRREMMSRMPGVPLVGTNRLASTQFAKSAGATVRGSYYTVVGPYAPQRSEAPPFLRDYRNAYGTPASALSLQAFDATNIVIAAMKRAVDDAGGKRPSRDQVLRQVGQTKDYRGVMGVTSFDGHGDTTLRLIAAYEWMAPNDLAGRFVAQLTIR